eukprot:365353-Chlamydomonas_euryale.AAC.2
MCGAVLHTALHSVLHSAPSPRKGGFAPESPRESCGERTHHGYARVKRSKRLTMQRGSEGMKGAFLSDPVLPHAFLAQPTKK